MIKRYKNVARKLCCILAPKWAQQRTRVYPTKVTDCLTIETTDQLGLPIAITDQLGRVVKRAQVSSLATTLTMAELAPGFYQVRVGQQVFRIVK